MAPAPQWVAELIRIAGGDDVHTERAAESQRLAELDARRAQWQDSLRSYSAQRQRILVITTLTPAQRAHQIYVMLARQFDVNERQRVDVLTRNGMLPG